MQIQCRSYRSFFAWKTQRKIVAEEAAKQRAPSRKHFEEGKTESGARNKFHVKF